MNSSIFAKPTAEILTVLKVCSKFSVKSSHLAHFLWHCSSFIDLLELIMNKICYSYVCCFPLCPLHFSLQVFSSNSFVAFHSENLGLLWYKEHQYLLLFPGGYLLPHSPCPQSGVGPAICFEMPPSDLNARPAQLAFPLDQEPLPVGACVGTAAPCQHLLEA